MLTLLLLFLADYLVLNRENISSILQKEQLEFRTLEKSTV